MKVIFLAFMFIFICAGVLPAQVIQYEIDNGFDSGVLFIRGGVSDLLVNNAGEIIVTGMFSNALSPAENTSLLSASGNLILPISGGNHHRLNQFLGGYIHFGNSGIQRFNLPGQPSPVFFYEWAKPAYSGPLSNRALDAMVLPDDHILVAGRFFTDSTLMGTNIASQGLRQLCMIDSTGAPVADFPMVHCAQPVTAEIETIHQLSTGEYIIAGSFSEVNGHPYAKLAKLNPDFSVNTDFGHVFGTSGTGVFTTLIDSQDRIWVKFGQNITVLGQPNYPSRLIRVMPDGSIDEDFDAPVFSGYGNGTYEEPLFPRETTAIGVLEDNDDTFIVYGQFTEMNGDHHRRLAKITDSGEIISGAFQSMGPDSAVWGNWSSLSGPIMGAHINVIRKLPDGKLLLGGSFSSFGGEPYSCLVRLQPAGFVGTDDRTNRGILKVYPNPARNHFRIELPEGAQHLESVQLWDLQGRAVRAWPAAQSQFATEGLPAGMYVVRVSSVERVYTQKLILEP